MIAFVSLPSGVSAAISARNISPVEMDGMETGSQSIMKRP
jgi:hypothetical protein